MPLVNYNTNPWTGYPDNSRGAWSRDWTTVGSNLTMSYNAVTTTATTVSGLVYHPAYNTTTGSSLAYTWQLGTAFDQLRAAAGHADEALQHMGDQVDQDIQNIRRALHVQEPAEHDLPEDASDEMVQEAYRQARVRQQEEQGQRQERRAQARGRQRAAQQRARTTLRALIGEERWDTWEAHQYVVVVSQSGRRYLLTKGHVENVHLLDEAGLVEATYCAHPPLSEYDGASFLGELPAEDVLIAQILLLTADEGRFLSVANRNHRMRGANLLWDGGIIAA